MSTTYSGTSTPSSTHSSSSFFSSSSLAADLPKPCRTRRRAAYYFAYGSNMSPTQMERRCPGATAKGLALLPGWTLIVNERGAANVLPTAALAHELRRRRRQRQRRASDDDGGSSSCHDGAAVEDLLVLGAVGPVRGEEDGVWGVLYHLQPEDERTLDLVEGAGWACTKYYADVDVLLLPGAPLSTTSASTDGSSGSSSTAAADEATYRVTALVYVDRRRVGPARAKPEFVARMNRCIEEAQSRYGLPDAYVQRAMRPFIPAQY